MKNNPVITIGRQFGSGGRDIGKLLADMMGISFFDRKLITEAVRRSGISQDVLESGDEKTPALWKKALLSYGVGFMPAFGDDSLFKIQADTIRALSEEGPCVVVGRCADYILRDNPRCINVFVCAPLDDRIARVGKRNGVSPKEAAECISRIDKGRAAYYDFYTDKRWGDSSSYHLCLDSSVLGNESSAEMIRAFAEKALGFGG